MREAAEAMIREAWEDEPVLAEALRTEAIEARQEFRQPVHSKMCLSLR